MQSLDRDSQVFENCKTEEMFAKTHGSIALGLSGTQEILIIRIGTVRLKCIFTKPLEGSIALISLFQFETYWRITSDGSVLLDLARWAWVEKISLFYLDHYMSKYKSFCLASGFLDNILSVNNILIIVNNSSFFIQQRILNFLILLAYRIHSTYLTLKTFFGKVENLLFKIGSKYKIHKLKVAVFNHDFILFFSVFRIYLLWIP